MKMIGLIMVSIVLVIGISAIDPSAYHMTEQQLDQAESVETLREVEKMPTREAPEIIHEMHKMANTLIYADEIWGKTKITPERVNHLLLEVRASDFKNKEEMLDILTRWKAGSFENGVEDHNTLWRWLDGTIGKAYGLNIDAIKKLEGQWPKE